VRTLADDAARTALAGWQRAKPPPTLREFSRTLTLPAGPLAGHHYDPDSDPCQRWLIDQLDSGRWERVAICAPPQYGGKTQVAILAPALRTAIACRLPVGYALPTLSDLDKAWQEKLLPAIRGSGYGAFLPTSGPGARGGRGPAVTFQDPGGDRLGRLVFLAGGAYGSTVATVLVDEADQFRDADGKPQWDALEDCFNRANSYGPRAMRIACGTIESDDQSIILELIDKQGTGTRPWPRCPHCARHQRLAWDAVRYDAGDEDAARQSAAIYCLHCATRWSEYDRLAALAALVMVHRGQEVDAVGTITGDEPRTRTLGLLWTALDSSLTTVAELAVEHFRASRADADGNPALLRKWTRYRECRPFLRADNRRPEPVESRILDRAAKSTHRRGQVPDGASRVVVGVDVQLRRHYALTLAVADDWWAIVDWARDAICGDMEQPTQAQRVDGLYRLDTMTRQGWERQSGGRATCDGAVIDAGYKPDELRPWVADQGGRWLSAKGASDELARRMGRIADPVGSRIGYEQGWYDLRQQPDTPDGLQLFVAVDDVLDRIAEDWETGRGRLPQDIDRELMRHLCGLRRGKTVRWEPRTDRWDYLACLTYALAYARHRGSSGAADSVPILVGGLR
jgi:hypothetical protein